MLLGIFTGFMDLMVDGLSPWVRNEKRYYDLIVVGPGPSGLAAGIHVAREGVSALVIERSGGWTEGTGMECIGHSSAIPEGAQGIYPAGRSGSNPKRFAIEMLPGPAVTWVRDDGSYRTVWSAAENEYHAKVLLMAPGTEYRRLTTAGEDGMHGIDRYLTESWMVILSRDGTTSSIGEVFPEDELEVVLE